MNAKVWLLVGGVAGVGCAPVQSGPSHRCKVREYQAWGGAPELRCFDAPTGELRGVLWASEKDPRFTVWVVQDGRDILLPIPAPSVGNWQEGRDETWTIAISTSSPRLCRIAHQKSGRFVDLELPGRCEQYALSLVSNVDDKTSRLLVFSSIYQQLDHSGLVGFLTVPR